MKKATFILALTLLLSSCKSETAATSASATLHPAAVAAVNDNNVKAPDFNLANIDGGYLKLSDLKGKVAVVDFWATDCAPCIQEIRDYNALYEKYKDKGVQFVGVTLESGGPDDIKPKAKEFQIKYPVVVGTEKVVEGFGGIIGTPTTFVLGPDGSVHHKYLGIPPGKKESLEKDIQDLLALQ